jgi:hypothetical protein
VRRGGRRPLLGELRRALGGTFDASLVELDARTHRVLTRAGIATLGGDDFDLLPPPPVSPLTVQRSLTTVHRRRSSPAIEAETHRSSETVHRDRIRADSR